MSLLHGWCCCHRQVTVLVLLLAVLLVLSIWLLNRYCLRLHALGNGKVNRLSLVSVVAVVYAVVCVRVVSSALGIDGSHILFLILVEGVGDAELYL